MKIAYLLTSITGFLISFWVVIYIFNCYQYPNVYDGAGPKAEEGEEETNYI